MRIIKHKKIIIICAIIICLGMLEIAGIIPYIVARTVSSIYIAEHYSVMELEFDYMDGSKNPVFKDTYSVIYKDEDGYIQGFVMYPKQFPVYILFDSIKGQG